ncbi:MAG: hypothetical protein IKW50_05145 [Oscillospiraceae bacterium]|nr:hypothetical protein [Oscillospiraceae bacterium]
MKSIKPKTYNELMLYKRCMDLRFSVHDISNDLMVRIYHFLNESAENTVRITNGRIVFYHNEMVTDSMVATISSSIDYVTLTRAYIVRQSVQSSGSDGGSSGNNNNNNNNTNHG